MSTEEIEASAARSEDAELKVFIVTGKSRCAECGEDLERGSWITLVDKGALCLACADFDHLVFLPRGDVAVTRRSKKYSALHAVVLKWSRPRRRYERQGLLVEEAALTRAEEDSFEDREVRARARERAAEYRAEVDVAYVERFALRVRELFPSCPDGREMTIARHACLKYSGRVGRTASAKALEEEAVNLAVAAHVRHAETGYDRLLMRSRDRQAARGQVVGEVDAIMKKWRSRG